MSSISTAVLCVVLSQAGVDAGSVTVAAPAPAADAGLPAVVPAPPQPPPQKSTPCSNLHPAQFTHVLLKMERARYTAYEPDELRDFRCLERPQGDGKEEGRFSISERGEIVIRFDSNIPAARAGTLLVTGKVVSGQSSREIEIPGYRVLGKNETPQTITDAAGKEELKKAIDTVVECAGAGCEVAKVLPLSQLKVDDSSVLKPFVDAASPTKSSTAEVETLKDLQASAKTTVDKLPTSWSDVRIQPKEIGAREGEVIEVRIKHSMSGQVVEPTWTLRFVVEKTGVYVHASPVLSLVWSFGFSPEDDFRGAQGLLAPGVEFTIDWFSGRYGPVPWLSFLVSGVGFGVDYLDFDSRQAVELGVKFDVQFFRGILSFGVGYNMGPQSPRLSDRSFYYSFGIGIDKVLDRAARVAEFFAQ